MMQALNWESETLNPLSLLPLYCPISKMGESFLPESLLSRGIKSYLPDFHSILFFQLPTLSPAW